MHYYVHIHYTSAQTKRSATYDKVQYTQQRPHLLIITPTDALSLGDGHFGLGVGPIFLDRVHCDGTENRLLDCEKFQPLGLIQCDHSRDVGVICKGNISSIFTLY